MRYEGQLDQIARDGARTAQLVEECVELNACLAKEVLEEDNRLLYEQLVELIIKVSDYLLQQHDDLRGKVRHAMGGEVLELINERAARLEREAREQGLKLGLEQGADQLARALKELGVDAATVDAARESMRYPKTTDA
ncbi:MAG: hypothetical protein Q4A01_09645 [Coriobacteriales bacterium]|nr:hypothetical protein [Coriobacteriales bacterium]